MEKQDKTTPLPITQNIENDMELDLSLVVICRPNKESKQIVTPMLFIFFYFQFANFKYG